MSYEAFSKGSRILIEHNLKIKLPIGINFIPLSPLTGGNGISQFSRIGPSSIEILIGTTGLSPTCFLYSYAPKLIV